MNNPLFEIAATKHKEDVNSSEYDFLVNATNNKSCYTLGFCRGVSYATDIFQKQIKDLRKQLAELTKPQ